ncbi:hypothetical protein NDA11_001162 [Ustilago hordei]|nr:hypothetical protein NDA11_001162 [Ustilago hordei]
MVALDSTSSTPAVTLPPPLQPRIPRAPIRIIVLCDGTAQQRNWVKTSINTATKPGFHTFHHSDPHSDATASSTPNERGDEGDKKKRKSNSNSNDPAAETGDFFTNVALLAKVIAQSSGLAPTSPPRSPKLGENAALDGDQPDPSRGGGVMPQVVFYQSGIGTGTGKIRNLVDQGTGLSLGSKIEEAYSFIVDNYQPGDELFLFGFSRGAYTARCISGLINWCGVLSKVEMTHFSEIWAAYQRRDPDDISSEVDAAETLYSATLKYPSAESEQVATNMYLFNLHSNSKLSPAAKANLEELRRKECAARRRKNMVVPPQIKVVGVWDTVSALGFPGMFQDNAMIDFFDFYDPGLGSNIQFAFHALSLEEDRKDFLPTMWYQPSVADTPSALPQSANGARGGARGGAKFSAKGQHMRSKQVLKQCWFQGVHTDCGGGYRYHGLSDITLIWMISQLVDPHTLPDGSTTLRPLLNIDLGLLASIIDRRREWGKQLPHRSRPTINYQHPRIVLQRKWDAETMKRTVWANMALTGRTNESIHPSVVRGGRIQPDSHPALAALWRDEKGGGREVLERMWKEAENWDGTLRPTEKLLYWDKRGPYPWVPGQGDWGLNPWIAPLIVSGGWNIPELARRDVKELVISAAQMRRMGDVDDSPEEDGGDGAAKGASGGSRADVDDQVIDGWGDIAATNPPAKPTDPTSSSSSPSTPTSTTLPILIAPMITNTPPPTALYSLIPSKELGENPVDPTTHPHLHSLFSTLYSLSTIPNSIIADILNFRLVPKTNLNQTMVQGWLWELGDKWAGYSDEVKVQALTAGLGLQHKKGKGGKGGKKLKKSETKAKKISEEESVVSDDI